MKNTLKNFPLLFLICAAICSCFSVVLNLKNIKTYSDYDSYYSNVGNISNFTLFNNNIYYVNELNELVEYKIDSNNINNNQTNIIAGLNNVKILTSTTNALYVLNNNVLNVFNTSMILVNQYPCTHFDVYKTLNNEDIITTYYNNIFSFLKIDSNFTVIDSNTLTDTNTILNVLSITTLENITFVLCKIYGTEQLFEIHNIFNLNDDVINSFITFPTKDTLTIKAFVENGNIYIAELNVTNSKLNIYKLNASSLTLVAKKEIEVSEKPSFEPGKVSVISDFEIVNGQIYISDALNNNIQLFNMNLDAGTITYSKVLISSQSYELGRFYSPNNLCVYDNGILVADTHNNRLQIINDSPWQITEYTYNANIKQIVNPVAATKDSQNNIIFAVNDCIVKLEHDTLAATEYNKSFNGFSTETIQDVYSLTVDERDNIFVIANNSLYYKTHDANTFTKLMDGLSIGEKSKIHKLYGSNNLLISSNNEAFYFIEMNLDNTISSVSNYKIYVDIKDFSLDVSNNIFVLTDTCIAKFYFENNKLIQKTIFNSIFNYVNLSLICIDNSNATTYVFDNYNQTIEKLLLTDSDFVEGFTNYDHPININNENYLNLIVGTATAKNNCFAYQFPLNSGHSYAISQNQKLIVLDVVLNNYHYVLFENNGVLRSAYITTSNLNITNYASTETFKALTFNNSTKVYKFPTILQTDTNQNLYFKTLEKNTQITIYKNPVSSVDNNKFYIYKISDNEYGYIDADDLIILDNKYTPITFVNPNAQILNKKLNSVAIYNSTASDNIQIDTLSNEKRIYVVDYNPNNKYTLITYITDDLEQKQGYVLTSYIKLDTWHNPIIITIIILITLSVTISITLVLILKYNSKRKKDL